GNTAYGTVRLPEGLRPDDFGIHPALLDAALHTLMGVRQEADGAGKPVFLPFEWTGVELYATGATELRVRIEAESATGENISLVVADGTGAPVAVAQGLRIREASAEQIRAGESVEHLYRVEFQAPRVLEEAPDGEVWVLGGNGEVARALEAEGFGTADEVSARLDDGTPAPLRLVIDTTGPDGGSAGDPVGGFGDGLVETTRTLGLVQQLISEQRLEETELVWLTSGAVDAGDGVRDLVHAPLWGLLRTARSEHPERAIRLVDVETPAADAERALAVAGEPEVAVREGEVRVARLVGVTGAGAGADSGNSVAGGSGAVLDPSGAVLITGGTGELGRAVAG
ncbi:polyketide synthase dehydratase domain-containing protein, partial [Streptomyces sp. NPDC057496]|uniref:polyketide synthase dehydratase domain-containing protein n=1 Tax=Streptomyces sp. NPDC057496 TaxID=3346149 RepID=UPI003698D9C8